MTLRPMTRQEVPPLLALSRAVLGTQWDLVGHITTVDRSRRLVGREKKKAAMSHFWDTHHTTISLAEWRLLLVTLRLRPLCFSECIGPRAHTSPWLHVPTNC